MQLITCHNNLYWMRERLYVPDLAKFPGLCKDNIHGTLHIHEDISQFVPILFVAMAEDGRPLHSIAMSCSFEDQD